MSSIAVSRQVILVQQCPLLHVSCTVSWSLLSSDSVFFSSLIYANVSADLVQFVWMQKVKGLEAKGERKTERERQTNRKELILVDHATQLSHSLWRVGIYSLLDVSLRRNFQIQPNFTFNHQTASKLYWVSNDCIVKWFTWLDTLYNSTLPFILLCVSLFAWLTYFCLFLALSSSHKWISSSTITIPTTYCTLIVILSSQSSF